MTPWLSRAPSLLWPALVLGTLCLHFWFPKFDPGTGRDTYSATAEGQKAFYRLVELQWDWAYRSTQPLARSLDPYDTEHTLCILGPARPPTDPEWAALLTWVSSGGRLLYAFRGDEQTVPQLGVEYRLNDDQDDAAAPQTKLTSSSDIAWWTDGRLKVAGATTLIEQRGQVQAAKLTHGNGAIVFCASALPFTNQLLTYGDNSVLAVRLLEALGPGGMVAFDESLNTSGVPRSVGLLLDPVIRPLTLQLLLITLLYGWWNSRRFGPLLPRLATPRQNIVEHTDALGNWYWRSWAGVGVLQSLLQQTQRELRGHATAAQERRRLEPIARRLGRSVDEILELLATAEHAASQPHLGRRAVARWIRHLAELRAARQS